MTPARARTLTVPRPGLPLADRWSRLVAWFVDKVLEIGSLVPGFVAAVVTAGEGNDLVLFLAISAPLYLGLWTYQAWLRATQGQTIGKWALAIRIVSHEDGSNPGFWRAVFLRDLVPGFINYVVAGLFVIVDVAFIFGRERRCVHDYMAMTIVVSADLPEPGHAIE